MRSFPSARTVNARFVDLSSLLLLLAVLALVVPTAVPLALAADPDDVGDLRDQKNEVAEQVEQAQQDVQESSRKVTKANAALAASQSALQGARASLDAAKVKLDQARARDLLLKQRLAEAEQRLAQAQADLAAGQAALAAQREVVKDLVVTLYQQGDPTLVGISAYVGAQVPSDLIRQDRYAQDATDKQGGIFDELLVAEVLLRVREGQVEAARDEVATRRAEAAAVLVEMKQLKKERKRAKNQVRDHVAANKVARSAALAARKADAEMLRDLKREEARVRKQLLAAIAAAAASAGGYNGNSDGYLDYPVAGRITSPYGYRIHPIYGYYGLHDGVDFGAGCGAPMRAVANGTVINAYYSSVYGNRLYVNLGTVNGKNLIAVYNHASNYRFGVGTKIRRGDVVGYVGSTGWSTGCHLHFTILRDGDPVDPMIYL